MDTATEARIVEIIDQALVDVSHARPVPSAVVDVLLDLRLRILELAVFDWMESAEGLAPESSGAKRGGMVALERRSASLRPGARASSARRDFGAEPLR
jgi:hypothetical protein